MIYFIISIWLIISIIIFDIKKVSAGKNVFIVVLYLLVLGMSSLRYRVGGDSLHYEDIYGAMPYLSDYLNYMKYSNTFNYQPLWILLCGICKSITTEYVFFQFIHSLIFNTILFLIIHKYSKYFFSVFAVLWFSVIYFYYAFEIQREIMAIMIFLLNINNLQKKKWIRFYVLAVFSFLFHISALIIFFLPFFTIFNLTRRNIIIIIISIFTINIFFRSFFLDLFMSLLFTEDSVEKARGYSMTTFSEIGFWAFYFIRVILIIPLAFYLCKHDVDSKIRTSWVFIVLLSTLSLAQGFVGFDRFANYFYIPYFILFIDFLYSSKNLFSQNL
jgi:hypothetical protein